MQFVGSDLVNSEAVGDRIARALRARGEEDDDDEDPQGEVDSDQPRDAENPSSKDDVTVEPASVPEEMEPGNASVSVPLPEEMVVPEQAAEPGNASVSVPLAEETVVPEQAAEPGNASVSVPLAEETAVPEQADPDLSRHPTKDDLERELRIAELKLEARRL